MKLTAIFFIIVMSTLASFLLNVVSSYFMETSLAKKKGWVIFLFFIVTMLTGILLNKGDKNIFSFENLFEGKSRDTLNTTISKDSLKNLTKFDEHIQLSSDTVKKTAQNINSEIVDSLKTSFKNNLNNEGYFIDERDNKKYKWKKIGSQIWMVENLAYKGYEFYPKENYTFKNNYKKEDANTGFLNSGGSFSEINSATYIEHYGCLYKWESAIKSCPKGWHIPSKAEWKELIKYHGGDILAGRRLSVNIGKFSGWGSWNTLATNNYGFSIIPGGRMEFEGDLALQYLTGFAYYWSSTESSKNHAISLSINHFDNKVQLNPREKNLYAQSVRCIKD